MSRPARFVAIFLVTMALTACNEKDKTEANSPRPVLSIVASATPADSLWLTAVSRRETSASATSSRRAMWSRRSILYRSSLR